MIAPLVALLLGAVSVAQTPPYRSESFVTRDSVRIRYLVQGSGPPIVLLHGFALNPELNWAEPGTMDSLAAQFTVIAVDLRGHGASGKPHDSAAYGLRFVDDVIALLDHLRIRRAHLVGYSLGGMITLRVLTSHPDRVISAVLGGSGWPPPGTPPPPFLGEWLAGLDRAARDGSPVSDVLVRADMGPLPPGVRAHLDRNDPAALAAALRTGGALAVSEAELRGTRVPLLAVVGENDRATVAANALKTVVPSATVTLIPGADHRTAITDPRLAAAIRAFARAHSP